MVHKNIVLIIVAQVVQVVEAEVVQVQLQVLLVVLI